MSAPDKKGPFSCNYTSPDEYKCTINVFLTPLDPIKNEVNTCIHEGSRAGFELPLEKYKVVMTNLERGS